MKGREELGQEVVEGEVLELVIVLYIILIFQARPNWRILYLYDVSIQIENKGD